MKKSTAKILPFDQRPAVMEIALDMLAKFSDTQAGFAAGSWQRGLQTDTSDLDLVLIGSNATPARHSLIHRGWPVEIFVQTLDSLRHFCEMDHERACPSLAHMITTGSPLPDDNHPLIRDAHDIAQLYMDTPLPILSSGDMDRMRYFITDLVDDLTAPRSHGEALAITNKLAPMIAQFHLGTMGKPRGDGKGLLRNLHAYAPDIAQEWEAAMNAIYAQDYSALIALADMVLAPHGGRLFDGYSQTANIPAQN